MKRFIFFLTFFLLFLFPKQISADEGWVVDDFHSDIAVQQSGEVQISETITVDFGNLSKHGIYRDIPYIYQGQNSEKTYSEIAVESVNRNNNVEKYELNKSDGYVHLKIGDGSKTISSKQTYTIVYRALGVLRGFPDHDELYWNVTGTNWPVALNHVEAVVTLPSNGLQKLACYEGYAGEQGECNAVKESSMSARFTSTEVLDADKGMTIVAGYTKGLVPLVAVQRPKTFWEKFVAWPSLTTLILALLSGLGTIFSIWYRYGRDYWFASNLFGTKDDKGAVKPIGGHEQIVVEFTPPEKLRPAEIGVLMDERADTTDVVATIIDLATRGYLTITEIQKKWLFGKVDYTLTKKEKATGELLEYEKILLNHLFESGSEITVSSLKTTFYTDLQEVKKALYEDVVAKGFFPTDPEKVRNTYLFIGIVLAILGGVIVGNSISADFVEIADIGICIAVSGAVLTLMSRFMPRRTAYGRDMYRRVRGYHLFIDRAEKYRQQFFEKRNMFNEVLPYAIMFGLTEKFAKQMKDMGVKTSQPGWYSGVNAFNMTTFGSNMNSFSGSLSSAIASAPSSSGFSGGSSGGGFGGGGGGSW